MTASTRLFQWSRHADHKKSLSCIRVGGLVPIDTLSQAASTSSSGNEDEKGSSLSRKFPSAKRLKRRVTGRRHDFDTVTATPDVHSLDTWSQQHYSVSFSHGINFPRTIKAQQLQHGQTNILTIKSPQRISTRSRQVLSDRSRMPDRKLRRKSKSLPSLPSVILAELPGSYPPEHDIPNNFQKDTPTFDQSTVQPTLLRNEVNKNKELPQYPPSCSDVSSTNSIQPSDSISVHRTSNANRNFESQLNAESQRETSSMFDHSTRQCPSPASTLVDCVSATLSTKDSFDADFPVNQSANRPLTLRNSSFLHEQRYQPLYQRTQTTRHASNDVRRKVETLLHRNATVDQNFPGDYIRIAQPLDATLMRSQEISPKSPKTFPLLPRSTNPRQVSQMIVHTISPSIPDKPRASRTRQSTGHTSQSVSPTNCQTQASSVKHMPCIRHRESRDSIIYGTFEEVRPCDIRESDFCQFRSELLDLRQKYEMAIRQVRTLQNDERVWQDTIKRLEAVNEEVNSQKIDLLEQNMELRSALTDKINVIRNLECLIKQLNTARLDTPLGCFTDAGVKVDSPQQSHPKSHHIQYAAI